MQGSNFSIRGRDRKTFTVPGTSGNYANERITFGGMGTGSYAQAFYGLSVLAEGYLANAVVEVWLPRVADGVTASSQLTDSDYVFSGLAPLTAAGFASWTLQGGWVGVQVRVKSGGTSGSMSVSATTI